MKDEALRERFLSSEEIYPGKIIRVEKWQVELPNGEKALREVVRHNGASAIVPVDGEGQVTLVRQHRVAIDRCTWEIPAGKLDSPAEDPFSAAQRELEEETGLQAAHWQKLTCIYTTPGFCNEQISIYLATGLSQHPAHPDADEFLFLTKMPLRRAVEMCMAGEIRDGKTVIGLLMANQALHAQEAPFLNAAASIQRFTGTSSSREAK
jgi:ADP-ribose pyrophosphatase